MPGDRSRRGHRDLPAGAEPTGTAEPAAGHAAWPPHSFASNYDGDRHVIVLADDADMDGWSVETTRGTWRLERDTVWGADNPNFLGIGAEVSAWTAPCDHGELIRFLPPGTHPTQDLPH